MSKRIASLLLAALLLFSCAFGASATTELPMELRSSDNGDPPPSRFSYTNYTLTGLNIVASGTAYCVADFVGYPGTTTRVDIEMKLQKRTLLLFWTDEQTWTLTFNSHSGTLSKSKAVTSGTYRVQATYTAYSGTKTETSTGTSPTQTY